MTVTAAIKKSGTLEAPPGTAIDTAEQMIFPGEKVSYAVIANCGTENNWSKGVLVVTTHRVLFCSDSITQHLLLKDCVGLGEITGRTPGRMKISADSSSVIVELGQEQLLSLQNIILDAVAAFPNQPPIDFSQEK